MREQEAHDLAELVEASLPYGVTVRRVRHVSREEDRFELCLWEGRPYVTRPIRVCRRLAFATEYVEHLLATEAHIASCECEDCHAAAEERHEANREYERMTQ